MTVADGNQPPMPANDPRLAIEASCTPSRRLKTDPSFAAEVYSVAERLAIPVPTPSSATAPAPPSPGAVPISSPPGNSAMPSLSSPATGSPSNAGTVGGAVVHHCPTVTTDDR